MDTSLNLPVPLLRMMRLIKILLTTACLMWAAQTKADSWRDPTWKKMLEGSDIIALIQYTGSGDFRASAKVLRCYKGKLKAGDEIWISGFSNRYGPIDKMHKGDQYLVFLNFNAPNDETIKYWAKELKTNPELKGYLEAYKNNKAYAVWSPTAGDLKVKGDKVQYDLVQTSFYDAQKYYSLSEFESFLIACYDKSKARDLCTKLLAGIKPVKESDLNAQYLMKLFLLGYRQYDNIFHAYIKVKNLSSKYALAQLMGNIKTEKSRNVLIELLKDNHPVVQGEVVRQLKNEPSAIVAPILLKRLKTAGKAGSGPSNVMDPVMNSLDGGKAGIIEALGELKYKPAIPDLLLLLDADDDLWGSVIEALKNIGTRKYIPYVNKQLDRKKHKLIFDISMMIARDSLTECLPALKRFISTCDRSRHPNYEYTISACCGIGHFRDKATVSFLLADYERFFTYKDPLESGKQKAWTQAYIETFADLKLKAARPLIYKSIHDWFGVDQNFEANLFRLKTHLEDSLGKVFKRKLEPRKYKLNHCIALIQNSTAVKAGQKPVVKYLVEATTPTGDDGGKHRQIIAKELNLSSVNVYIRFSSGIYDIEIQERFNKSISSTPLEYFLTYAEAVPNQADVNFLQSLLDNHFISEDYYLKRVQKTIDKIKVSYK